MYDGAQLALLGDVVVVTVNHRLASFGYTHLAALGAPAEFKSAGECGVMDLVASLEWVRDNIARFRRRSQPRDDLRPVGRRRRRPRPCWRRRRPKASFTAPPSRAARRCVSPAKPTRRSGRAVAREARNLTKPHRGDPAVSWQQLLEAQIDSGGQFAPVMDGRPPHHPFDPAAPPESGDVPVIISTTLEDAALRLTNFDLNEPALTALFSQRLRARESELLALYRPDRADKTPYLIQAQAFTDAPARRGDHSGRTQGSAGGARLHVHLGLGDSRLRRQVRRGARARRRRVIPPVPRRDRRSRATRRGKMVDRLASAWVAFAKTGDPNNQHIPPWPAYDASRRATMIFDTDTRGSTIRGPPSAPTGAARDSPPRRTRTGPAARGTALDPVEGIGCGSRAFHRSVRSSSSRAVVQCSSPSSCTARSGLGYS